MMVPSISAFVALSLSWSLVAGTSQNCDADVDEVVQLQVSGQSNQLSLTSPEDASDCEKGMYITLTAEHGLLVTDKSKKGEGTLTVIGDGLDEVIVIADRPKRYVTTIPTTRLVAGFDEDFSPSSGGFPNAVLTGLVKGKMKKYVIVLTAAKWQTVNKSLVFNWKVDDDVIDDEIAHIEHVSLFIDSLFCIIRHPKSYVEAKLCTSLAGSLVKKGVGAVTCLAEDLEGLGLCAAIDVEDGELLTPLCEGLVVAVCQTVVTKISEKVISEITSGKVTIKQACINAGYPNPCS